MSVRLPSRRPNSESKRLSGPVYKHNFRFLYAGPSHIIATLRIDPDNRLRELIMQRWDSSGNETTDAVRFQPGPSAAATLLPRAPGWLAASQAGSSAAPERKRPPPPPSAPNATRLRTDASAMRASLSSHAALLQRMQIEQALQVPCGGAPAVHYGDVTIDGPHRDHKGQAHFYLERQHGHACAQQWGLLDSLQGAPRYGVAPSDYLLPDKNVKQFTAIWPQNALTERGAAVESL